MRMLRVPASLVLATLLILAGCSGGTGEYEENWGAEDTLGAAKADGLLDIAREVKFGDVVTGTVGGDQLNVYAMKLQTGDEFRIVETVKDGDLNPHLTLYYGTSVYVSSENWERSGNVLTKWYKVDSAGTYMLALRAYHGEGEGRYELTATCLGGPCNGEFPDPEEELTVKEVATCIQQARRCAFERMARYNGAVGPARAQELMDECLAEAHTPEGYSCAKACTIRFGEDSDWMTQPAGLCEDIKSGIVFYADQSAECLELLDDCMSSCYDAGDYNYWSSDPDEFWTTAEAICWSTGFNGNCDGFARGHEKCGGSDYPTDSIAECFELCESTDGAWVDDLDTICSDSCDDMCDGAREQCAENCPDGDHDCYRDCIDETAPGCD